VCIIQQNKDYMSKVFQSHKSVLLDCSSDNGPSAATNTDNGAFTISLENPGHELTKAVKCVPKTITFTHIFPNVDQYHNTFTFFADGNMKPAFVGTTVTISLPIGQYTGDRLATAINEQLNVYLFVEGSISVDWVDARYVWTYDDPGEAGYPPAVITSPLHGFLSVLGGATELSIPPASTVMMPYSPNLGGPKHVYVHSRRLAPSNLYAANGRSHHVLDVVSLAETVYGATVTKHTDDLHVADVDYRKPEEFSTIDFRLTDSLFRRLFVPPNHPVHVIMKVYHAK